MAAPPTSRVAAPAPCSATRRWVTVPAAATVRGTCNVEAQGAAGGGTPPLLPAQDVAQVVLFKKIYRTPPHLAACR